MKVALIQETVDIRRGGAETSTLEMASHLARRELDVSIICSARGTEPATLDNVHLLPIPPRGLTRAWRTYNFVQDAQHLCRAQRYDIIHAITPCPAANIYQPRGGTYTETIARGLAVVPSPALRWIKSLGRRFNIRQRFLHRLESLLLKKRRQRVFVAAVSEYVRQQVVIGYGFPTERTEVIFNGVDIAPLTATEIATQRAQRREQLGVAPDARLALFVAHNFKLKGLAELIRARALSAARRGAPWEVVVAGRDNPRYYQRLARQLGVENSIHFVGTDVPIRDWYAAVDVLAHPTWYDPCSRVVLEALSCGRPVVTTRFNGAAEVMNPGRHGVIIDTPADIVALVVAIERAFEADIQAACAADAANLREKLSMQRHANELHAMYTRVLANC